MASQMPPKKNLKTFLSFSPTPLGCPGSTVVSQAHATPPSYVPLVVTIISCAIEEAQKVEDVEEEVNFKQLAKNLENASPRNYGQGFGDICGGDILIACRYALDVNAERVEYVLALMSRTSLPSISVFLFRTDNAIKNHWNCSLKRRISSVIHPIATVYTYRISPDINDSQKAANMSKVEPMICELIHVDCEIRLHSGVESRSQNNVPMMFKTNSKTLVRPGDVLFTGFDMRPRDFDGSFLNLSPFPLLEDDAQSHRVCTKGIIQHLPHLSYLKVKFKVKVKELQRNSALSIPKKRRCEAGSGLDNHFDTPPS